MYLYGTITNKDQMKNDLFFTLNEAELARTAKVEVWATEFNDHGNDFCEARFFEANKTQPYKKEIIAGY